MNTNYYLTIESYIKSDIETKSYKTILFKFDW